MYKIFSREVLLFISVYFVQGAVTIIALAEFLLTRNAFQFSWIQLALLTALTTLTWSIKPVYGFLTDLCPLFSSRRKSYLFLTSLMSSLGYIGLAFFGSDFVSIGLALVVINIGLGFTDVIADGLVVERSNAQTVGLYQSLCWRAKGAGIFGGALLSGFLVDRAVFSNLFFETGWPEFFSKYFPKTFPSESPLAGIDMFDIRFIFLLAGALPLITFFITFLLQEKKVAKSKITANRKKVSLTYIFLAGLAFVLTALNLIFLPTLELRLIPFLSNEILSSLVVILLWGTWILFYINRLVKTKVAPKTIFYVAIFLFLWRFTPSFGAPWSDYFINTLSLSREKLGYIATLTPLAWIIGSFIYANLLDKFPVKKILKWTVLAAVVLSFTQLSIASPELGLFYGSWPVFRNLAGVLLYPAYFLVYGSGAWSEVMAQSPILNLDAVLTFFLEVMFIISFLPLLKLAALSTPKGIEAINFAVLASVMNLGLAFGSILGGIIYTYLEGTYELAGLAFTGLHLTIIIGALMSLVCLPVLRKIEI